MDKRSWPWRKKTSDKTLICTDVGESSPSQASKAFDDQVIPVLKLDHIRTSAVPMSPHQADETIRRLNARLLAADDLAKQHATVAEEAVSGWEKAKAEYMSVKYQLDIVLEQKQAADVRVFHLDGALKECMQQLRQFREDQEQKIHEAVIKRSRDWDKMRLDLEERLADADRQLMDAGNQRNLLYKTMQEQAEAVAELGQVHSQAEAEIKKLQVQIQTLEKENTSLKYEIVILNKELDIRNQEREINSRSIDMASRQQLEGTKRIAKLEAECQRLRALVRKKLPGPGALLQMKLEAGVDAEKGDFYSTRRSGGRSVTSPKASHADSIIQSERMLALEEETEMLREELAKRNKAARLLCGQTTDKLSSLDGQVGHFPKSPRMPFIGPGFHGAERSLSKVPSQLSMSEDGNDDARSVADSWTSGFVSELAHSQKEKSAQYHPNIVHSHKVLERLNSIDDFIEIERLVSMPSEKQGVQPNIKIELSPSSISKQVLAKDAELQAANKLCAQVNKKLVSGEEQLNLLCSKNVANELNLFNIQQKLITILQDFERGDSEMVLENLKKALSALQCSAMDECALKLSNDAAPDHSTDILRSLENSHFHKSSQVSCFGEDKICKIGPELTTVICKLVRVVEDLASEGIATSGLRECQPINAVDLENGHRNIQSSLKPRPLELEAGVRNFTAISNQYLYGKAELVQFMAELCSVLSQMKNVNSIKVHSSLSSRMRWRPEAVQVAEQEVLSDVGSPVSLTSNSDGSESLAAKGFTADDRLASSKRASLDDDLQKVRAEKEALESHLRTELSRMATVEQMLAKLKQEKSELENKLVGEREKFDNMKSQFLDSEQLVATLRSRLASAELSGMVAEKSFSSITAVKGKLEAQLEDSRRELTHLHEKLKNLERVIDQEHRRNKELQMKVEELEALLQRADTSSVEGDAEKSNKEQEIADATEKLAECQRTIFVLGKQLKDIATSQDASSIAIKSSTIQTQEDEPKDELKRHGNMVCNYKDKQKVHSDLVAAGISDVTSVELNLDDEGTGPSDLLLVEDDKSEKPSLLHAEVDKQLVLYVPKPASKKKTSHMFGAIDMSKSLNLEPSASPRKNGSSFSRFFSRNKYPS